MPDTALPADPRVAFDAARSDMLRAFWQFAQRATAAELAAEIAGAEAAMQQMAALAAT